MPYNTRRKSLSLPALGIQLPQTARARRESLSAKQAAAAAAAAAGTSSEAPPAKRVKRSHDSAASPPASALKTPLTASAGARTSSGGSGSSIISSRSPPASAPAKSVTFADRPLSRKGAQAQAPPKSPAHQPKHSQAHTPPPSPGPESARVDVEGINDDVVVDVIEQLQTTGNRPHLIKELATVLGSRNASVANSVNPSALLSSRLASYMKRPWTALEPCPIGKELIPVHPRKVFYYLTTSPRQAVPASPSELLENGASALGKRIISPSLSNASQGDDEDNADASSVSMTDADDRKRAALSPSPEIDLLLDLDEVAPLVNSDSRNLPDFPTPGSSLSSSRSSLARDMQQQHQHDCGDAIDMGMGLGLHRRVEPAKEGDEREFEDAARDMARQGMVGTRHGKGDASGLTRPSSSSKAGGSAPAVEVTPAVEDRLRQQSLNQSPLQQRLASTQDSCEDQDRKNSEAARTLFVHSTHLHTTHVPAAGALSMSSPVINPLDGVVGVVIKSEAPVAFGVHDVVMYSSDEAGDASASASAGVKQEVAAATGPSVSVDTGPGPGAGAAALAGADWDIGRPENMALDELEDFFEGF